MENRVRGNQWREEEAAIKRAPKHDTRLGSNDCEVGVDSLGPMTTQTLPSVAHVAQRLSSADYAHKLGLAVLAQTDRRGWAYAVLTVDAGEVLAYDGWYKEDELIPQQFSKSIVDDYDWSNLDDMPSKQLLDANGFWLGMLVDLLQPDYSIDECAARALESHFGDNERLREFTPVAYYPLRVENVIASVEDLRGRGLALSSFSDRANPLHEALEKLRSL